MATTNPAKAPKQIPFEVNSLSADNNGYRLGHLNFPRRAPIDTPHYVAVSSRGAIPHISQDVMRDNTRMKGMYTALEDYIEKAPSQRPPVYGFPAAGEESPLRKFIALQKDALLILGPRRIPPLPCSAASTSTSIAIVTSFGFTMLECKAYVEAVQRLRPDIAVAMGDVLYGHQPGVKRADRMGDRTQSWLQALITGWRDADSGTCDTALFAPILPIEPEKQSWYLEALEDDFKDNLSGLVLYETESVGAIPRTLLHLPRLWMGDIKTPHQLLDIIASGVDIFTIPFIHEATDAGIAFDFIFDLSWDSSISSSKPLGMDLWSSLYAVDLSPLCKDCLCYTCTNHHRAYVQHLLNAKEMLGWVLLQLHNYNILDNFSAAVRRSICQGTFEHDKAIFGKAYVRDFPTKTGQGPRIRGYQSKSEGKEPPRKNPVAYRSLNDRKERLAEVVLPSPSADAVDLEQVGFAEIFEEKGE
ncbi:MAG: hypothetical protein Q9217_002655 [Psora testacea]